MPGTEKASETVAYYINKKNDNVKKMMKTYGSKH